MTDAAVVSSAEPVVASQTEPVVSESVSQYIGEDGRFQKGWIDGLVPEDLRSEVVFKDMDKTNPNVKDALKMLGNLQRVIGKKGLVQPTDSSTPSEWDAFYKALGRPDKSEEYKVAVKDELKQYYTDDSVKAGKDLFHKIGLNQKQAEALWEFDKQRLEVDLKQKETVEEQQKIDSVAQLKKELGAEYDDYIHIGNRMISENTQEGEQRDKLVEKFGNDPEFIKFVGNIGKKFMEHKGVPVNTERSSAMSLSEAKNKMDEVARTLADKTLVYNNPGLHSRLTQEMAGLAKLVSPK